MCLCVCVSITTTQTPSKCCRDLFVWHAVGFVSDRAHNVSECSNYCLCNFVGVCVCVWPQENSSFITVRARFIARSFEIRAYLRVIGGVLGFFIYEIELITLGVRATVAVDRGGGIWSVIVVHTSTRQINVYPIDSFYCAGKSDIFWMFYCVRH